MKNFKLSLILYVKFYLQLLMYRRSVLRLSKTKKTKLNFVALVRERTIPTERPPPVGEVSANFCG
jgi:hypothetical protein